MSDTSSPTAAFTGDAVLVFITRSGDRDTTTAKVIHVEPSFARRARELYAPALIVETSPLELVRLERLGLDGLHLHALPRGAQLDELERLAVAGRRRVSPRELVRFGWCDAPRRPCYRAPRRR
jgi:hypothetical protein